MTTPTRSLGVILALGAVHLVFRLVGGDPLARDPVTTILLLGYLAIAWAFAGLGTSPFVVPRSMPALSWRLYWALALGGLAFIEYRIGLPFRATLTLATGLAVWQLWTWGYPDPQRQLASR